MENKIYSSIVNVISDIDAIKKDKKSTQGFMYRGVDDVSNTLKPLFAKHKIFIVPSVKTVTRETKATTKGGEVTVTILDIDFTFYAEDGSFVTASTVGEAMDSGDKSCNKAMSIAFKYACYQVFCIPTDDMDDPETGEEPQYSEGTLEQLQSVNVPLKSALVFLKQKHKTNNVSEDQLMEFIKQMAKKREREKDAEV